MVFCSHTHVFMFIRTGVFMWTQHIQRKMKFYGLSESRLKRIVRHPTRLEEGIAPNTVACMQPGGSPKNPYEVWVMYQTKTNRNQQSTKMGGQTMCMISAWRYPGVSPKRNPIPQAILDEVLGLLE